MVLGQKGPNRLDGTIAMYMHQIDAIYKYLNR